MAALYNAKRIPASPDKQIALLARRQHGVFTRAQAIECTTKEAIRWRVRSGRWERLYPRVYRLAGAPSTWRQQAMAACLHLGEPTVLSHRAAALLGSLVDFTRARVEVTVPRNRNRAGTQGIKIHWTRIPIPAEDVTTIQSIPVTKPARTLLDLAAVEPEAVIERYLDDLLRRRLVSLPFLERWLQDPGRKGHRGAPLLQRLVGARATVGVTESPLETRLLRLLREAGLPIPMLQYEVLDGIRFVARLDFAYPHEKVAIEADGFRYHDNRHDFDNERARGNDLQALGWRVLRVTSKHLDQEPAGVIAWVRRARGSGTTSP